MNCEESQDRLAAQLLGEGPPGEADASHAASCPVCGPELESLNRTIALLRDLDWGMDDGTLVPERRAFLHATAATPLHWSRRPWAPPLAAALTAVAVGAWLIPMMRTEGPQSRQERLLTNYGQRPRPTPSSDPTTSRLAGHDPNAGETLERLRALGYIRERLEGGVPVSGVLGRISNTPEDMFFETKGTNPFVATERDALSTFGLDVDTASYTLARNYLRRGFLPPASAVRVEEFVNALPQRYAPPTDDTFAIHLEGAPSPFAAGRHLLRVGIRAKDVPSRERKPALLTFVIDVSGSMALENRLGLVKRSLRLLVDRLDERDLIGIVVYGTNGRVVLEPTPASERHEILGAIAELQPEGSTNLEEGLDRGYRMATRMFDPSATNRVVLCTDGVANNGVTNAATLLAQIRRQAEKGIDMIALGFGMGNYNDALLQRLADEGDGLYAYIDDDREARSFFLRKLTSVLEVVARDGKAQVEFDPGRVVRYRLLGYEKRDIADEAFRDESVDGGEINAGHSVTVVYELELRGGGGPLGTVHLRYTEPDSGMVREVRREIGGRSLHEHFEDASASFQTTVVTARLAEHLRRSRWVRGEPLAKVLEVAEGLPPAALHTAEAMEVVGMIRDALRLSGRDGN